MPRKRASQKAKSGNVFGQARKPAKMLRTALRRVRKLYLAPGQKYFACRRCCDLRYASQCEDYAHRAMSKAQAIRVRLGGSAAMLDEFPPKPKRMRWKTYRLLRARAEELWEWSLRVSLRLLPG